MAELLSRQRPLLVPSRGHHWPKFREERDVSARPGYALRQPPTEPRRSQRPSACSLRADKSKTSSSSCFCDRRSSPQAAIDTTDRATQQMDQDTLEMDESVINNNNGM